MRGRVSSSPIPVYAPPPPDYAGSNSAASHVWWDGAAAGSPNRSSPADWVNDVHPAGGYVNLLQTPASFSFPHQIPSRPDMPHNYNFVASSSQHTPLPVTQPSATKKIKKGASNKRTHSRSINLEDDDDGESSNKKRMTWTTKEDERLMGAWLSNSNDAISGNYKKNDQYWDAVTAEYNSNTSDSTRKRQTKQCMSRWHRVNKFVNDFHAIYIQLSQVYSSGQSESDLMDKVQIKYEKDHGPFLHKATWEACKKFPKWHAYNAQMHGSKKRDVADLGDVGVKSSPDDIPRPPMGVKKAKAERDGKCKNKQVSKDMEELNRYIEAQEEANKNRTAVLEVQKRISHDKVEASRLALEAAKENKEAKTKSKMLEQYTKLLTHDTTGMPDDMKAEHLKAISLMRETLWGKTHQS